MYNIGNGLDLHQTEIANAIVQVLASDPVSPVNGQIWVNSSSWTLKIRLNGITIALGRLDQISAPTGTVSMNSQLLSNLLDPVSDQDATTRAWVLQQIRFGDVKDSVRAVATTNVDTSSAPASIDGVTLASGNRVALVGNSTASQNGVYVFSSAGAPLTRAADADSSAEVTSGMRFYVEEGSTGAGKTYQLTTANPITLGSTSLTFAVVGAGSSLAKYSNTFGDNSTTQFTINHNLGSEDVTVAIRYAAGTKEAWLTDWRVIDSNNIRVDFAVAPTTNQFRVTVVA